MLSLSSCAIPSLPPQPPTPTPLLSKPLLLLLQPDAHWSNRRRKHARQKLFHNNLYLQQCVNSGAMDEARKLFDRMPVRTLVSWTLLLSGYVNHGLAAEALALFERMLWGGTLVPDSYVYSVILRACAAMGYLDCGRGLHGHVVKRSSAVEVDSFVENALLNMYASCGAVEDMASVFNAMDHPDLVAYSTMLSGYVKNGFEEEALSLFLDIVRQGMPLDTFLLSLALGVCATLCVWDVGLQLHCYVIKNGFGPSLFLNNSMLDFYAKAGELEAMEQVFLQMPSTDVVSWNTCITGFVYNSYYLEAVRYFRFMMQEEVTSCDYVTVISILKAVTMLGDERRGREVHAYIMRKGFEENRRVMWSLLNMYIDCSADLESSDMRREVQVKLINRFEGSYLDEFMISSMLKSCSLRNDLDSGKVIHSLVIKSDLGNSDQVVASLLISMYYKCGLPEAADMVFLRVEAPGSGPWSAFISGRLGLISTHVFSSSYSYLKSLNVGRQVHAYITKTGHGSQSTVGNSLVEMYSSCGAISEAVQAFNSITDKTPFSWAAMLSARVDHGFSAEALDLFSHIRCNNDHVKDPSVISSYLKLCGQLGLVDDAYSLFTSLEDALGMKPSEELYAFMVDVFGRAGLSEDLQEFVSAVSPLNAGPVFWKAVVSSCRLLGNMEVAKHAVEKLMELEPTDGSACLLLEQVLLTLGQWDEASKLSLLHESPRGVHYSSVEIRNRIYHFFSDQSPTQDVSSKLGELREKMSELCYVADKNHMLHNAEEGGHGGSDLQHTEMQALAFGLISSASAVPVRVMKSVRMCGDCHSAFKFMSTFVNRQLVVKDSSTFHNFRDGRCTCRDRW
uniref:DYW domain-containing protein n=1 Tax=Kalanchoe fedtschenkoi TaxID=63787 RepID=A0A7N0VE51_KALFE